MEVFFDRDTDRDFIRTRKVAVVGYGNQGRPQALNLRDSGVRKIIVAARESSASGDRALQDGFDVMTAGEAAEWADLIVLVAPDEEQAKIYREDLKERLRPGSALMFAHGLNIHFQLIEIRQDIDVVMVAPKGPGTALRNEFVQGGGLVSLFAVHQDFTGSAEALALSYAAAIGSGRKGIIRTSFQEECEADLFNEQAVLWGAIPELILAGYETLVEAGFSPEVAYLECVTEVKLLADLIYERGIAEMREAISNTAEFGALEGGTRIVNAASRTEMRRILGEIQSGHFAGKLMQDASAGYPRLKASRASAAEHPIEAVGKRLRTLSSNQSLKTSG